MLFWATAAAAWHGTDSSRAAVARRPSSTRVNRATAADIKGAQKWAGPLKGVGGKGAREASSPGIAKQTIFQVRDLVPMGEPSTTYAGAALAATEAFSLTNASASVANATEAFLSDTVTFLTHPPDAGSVANATETFLNDAVHFLTETDAYSWSVDRLKDSQSAYTWSKDVVLQVQSRGQQRLQSLGLLPGWLTAAAASGESVAPPSIAAVRHCESASA